MNTEINEETNNTIKDINNETQTVEVEIKATENLTTTKTPTHDLSWYVKWVASLFAIIGIFLAANNIFPYNIIFQFIGLVGWAIVGILWNDRAIILLNAIAASVLAQGIFTYFLN